MEIKLAGDSLLTSELILRLDFFIALWRWLTAGVLTENVPSKLRPGDVNGFYIYEQNENYTDV